MTEATKQLRYANEQLAIAGAIPVWSGRTRLVFLVPRIVVAARRHVNAIAGARGSDCVASRCEVYVMRPP